MEIAHMLFESTESAQPTYLGHMGSGSSFFFGGMMILGWITWILVIIALVLLIRRLWIKGGQK